MTCVFLFAVDKRNKSSNNLQEWKGTRRYPFLQLGLYEKTDKKKFKLYQGFPLTGSLDGFMFLCVNEQAGIREIIDGKDIQLGE